MPFTVSQLYLNKTAKEGGGGREGGGEEEGKIKKFSKFSGCKINI